MYLNNNAVSKSHHTIFLRAKNEACEVGMFDDLTDTAHGSGCYEAVGTQDTQE